MYEIGIDLINLARNDNAWLEAIVVISGYLVKSSNHVWDAIELSKRGALAAPENSKIQILLITSLITNIDALPTPRERAKAASSVVTAAPQKSTLMVISIDVMLNNVVLMDNTEEKQQYLKIAIHYAPPDSPVKMRADVLIRQMPVRKRKPERTNNNDPLLGFLARHKNNVVELFKKSDKTD